MRSVIVYMQERFPLPLVGLMAVCFGVVNLGLFADAPSWAAFALLALAYLAVLLRYRVTDEWKDFAHDSSVYPDRPLQRGAITVRALVLLGVAALVVELGSVFLLGGGPGLLAYLPFLALSALTAVEFFARDLLARHFTASFLLHELAYLPLFGWAAFVLGAPASGQTAAGIVAACLLFVVAEVVRKFSPRFDTDGALVPDTYPAVWGRSRAIVVIVLSLLAAAALAVVAGTGLVVLGVAVVFAVAVVLRRRSDRAVMVLGGVSVPALALAMLL
jgi:hypothetical protein